MFSNIQKKDYRVVDLIRQREIQVSREISFNYQILYSALNKLLNIYLLTIVVGY